MVDEIRVPVVFIIFNRPESVKLVFEQIRNAKPKKLYIVADGPRENVEEDILLCKQCRDIVSNIDWECQVYRNYADKNLGCGMRPASGLDWIFENEEAAIILEDDCIPSISFFYFCQELLERYWDDERVYSISGMNFDFQSNNNADYFFSIYMNTWGWATWRRVWKHYDYDIKQFPTYKASGDLEKLVLDLDFVQYWYKNFDMVYKKELCTAWDYQFVFMSFLHKGLHIYPQTNLIRYIGFNEMATHCKYMEKNNRLYYSTRVAHELTFPLRHPSLIEEDFRIDYLQMRECFGVKRKLCRDLTVEDIEVIKSFDNVLIYGAGSMCRDVIYTLSQSSIEKFTVVVSNLENKQYIMGNLVHEISEYEDRTADSIVLLSAGEKYHHEMIKRLKKIGFSYLVM